MKKKLLLVSLLVLALMASLVLPMTGCGEGELILTPEMEEFIEEQLAGLKGEQGEPGPQGIQGVQGPKGEQGEPGLKGSTGAKGATGATGATGSTGEQGIQGEQGPRGSSGARGAAGPQGEPGENGEQGIPGPPGPVNYRAGTGIVTDWDTPVVFNEALNEPYSVSVVITSWYESELRVGSKTSTGFTVRCLATGETFDWIAIPYK